MYKNENIFFTADLHYGSKNIIKYCDRPFDSVEDMNEALISNWNKKVKSGDIVYILGDVIWGHKNYECVMKQLNGQKHLILGNHDNRQSYKKLLKNNILQSVNDVKSININGQHIYLSHYPHRSWNMAFHGSWMLYGHCHDSISDFGLSCDVGVDKWNYEPVSYNELKKYFSGRDKFYNHHLRDDYESINVNFYKHFTDKYLQKCEEDAIMLEELLK